ncbi:MAG: hypothetical protein U1B30_16495, partial [Pseudomonadota bacterium]|nr:hypothetical protein [Pseudomonadota bacterium]
AGVDWGNVGSPTTAQNLSATNIDVDQVVASVSGAVGSVAGLTAATVHSDLDDIQARLPAALTANGNMKASIQEFLTTALTEALAGQITAAFKQFFDVAAPSGTMKAITNVVTTTNLTTNNDKTGYAIGAGGIDAAAFAAGAIAAAAIAADAIGASEFAQAAADKVFGTGGAALPEVAQGIPSATPRPDQALMLLYMALRNAGKSTATERRILNDAGTVIAKSTMSDDGTTFDQGELVSGP